MAVKPTEEPQFINPDAHEKFLGKTFVGRQHEVVLRIGTKEWSRQELAQKIGIANIAAAGKLSTALRKARVASVEQLYAIDPREFAMIKGLGETTIFVCLAILSAEGFNVGHWYASALGAKSRAVTFRTMKLNQQGRKRR